MVDRLHISNEIENKSMSTGHRVNQIRVWDHLVIHTCRGCERGGGSRCLVEALSLVDRTEIGRVLSAFSHNS